MKKRILWGAIAGLLLMLTACSTVAEAAGTARESGSRNTEVGRTAGRNKSTEASRIMGSGSTPAGKAAENSEMAESTKSIRFGQEGKTQAADVGQTDSREHILIAYFTWAENTHVERPETVDVDAATSASVLLPGNTALLANQIQKEVGGDLFSIVVTEPYSSDYDECLDRASDELARKARPELTARVEHMEQYDTVFLGFPDWWSTCPMAVFTFLESYDFSGKTVIPFCAHGTSGVGRSIRDIRSAFPDVKLLKEVGVYRQDMGKSENIISEWLKEIGM